MNLRDIIEGYQVVKHLQKNGYVQDDKIGLGEFIRMVIQADRNIKARKEESNEKE